MSSIRLVTAEEAPGAPMPLRLARLCSETTCERVFSAPDETCPRCGSQGLPLQRLLDGRKDYTALVDAVKGLLVFGLNLNQRQRRALVHALRLVGTHRTQGARP